jgi:hypothetical protein
MQLETVLISACVQVYEWIMKSLNSDPAPLDA